MSDIAQTSRPRIGFIGLGGMGARMAGRLMASGYRVAGYNRSRSRSEALQRLGAAIAESPRDLALKVEVLMVSVTDDAALAEVMYGPHGALDGTASGSIVIDLSTVHPRASVRLFEAARVRGIDVLDAPVSGSLPQAEQRQLIAFVGGLTDARDRFLRGVLDILRRIAPCRRGERSSLNADVAISLGTDVQFA